MCRYKTVKYIATVVILGPPLLEQYPPETIYVFQKCKNINCMINLRISGQRTESIDGRRPGEIEMSSFLK